MLVDFQIRRALEDGYASITPFDEGRLGPASYDVTLGKEIRTPVSLPHWAMEIDPHRPEKEPPPHWAQVHMKQPERTSLSTLSPDNGYLLEPGAFILACTAERITLSREMVARVEGKSSLGRLGIAVHITAGFIDPGFKGQVTLEIKNLGPWSIVLRPGMPIAQLAFEQVERAEQSYGDSGHYQGQAGPTESRYRFLR